MCLIQIRHTLKRERKLMQEFWEQKNARLKQTVI
jgi:hypothetical protein